MKVLSALIFLFFTQNLLAASAFQGREDKLFELLRGRLKGIDSNEKFHAGREYYHFSFDSERPRYIQKYKENDWWINNQVMFFADKAGKVSQVAIISYMCGVEFDIKNQNKAKELIQKLLKRESKAVFGKEISLSAGEFKSLGPEQRKIRRVVLKKSMPGVSKIRLSRGFYKCDGKGGHGHRVDFFVK